jgi:acetolactate synthase-1/2/3 large subunit
MNATSHKQVQSGGQAVASALKAHGVSIVFGIPGTHNLGFFVALADAGIRNITTRHEQGAGYAADGYARSSNEVGVFITTTGPGATNGVTALGQAFSDSVPVLLIAPGMPTGHPSFGNGLLHEQLNQRATFDGVVEHAHRVESVEEIPGAIAQAFARMTSGRPRPEYLEIPLDLIDATAEIADIVPLPASQPVVPRTEDIQNAAKVLANAKNPVIVAGGGAGNASAELTAVAEKLGAPVITSTNGKGAIPESHKLALGSGVQLAPMVELVGKSDALLVVGSELADADWFLNYPTFPETVIRIDIDPSALVVNTVPSHPLLGDSAATLQALNDALGAHTAAWSEDAVAQLKDTASAAQEESASVWIESLQALNEVLPENSIIAADNTTAAYNGSTPLIRLQRTKSNLFPTGFGTLGYGLPAGIGAKLSNPDAAVVVIQGDGGIMFVVGELAAAAQAGLALPIIVYDNGGYGEIHNNFVDRGDEPQAVALPTPDFAALAKSVGCHGIKLDNPTDVGEAVTKALKADRPTVIQITEFSRAAEGLQG